MSAGERFPADEVVDDRPRHRFVLDRTLGLSQLVYEIRGDRVTLVHTEVPEALRGRGLAGRLVAAAVDRANDEGLTIVPACPYVASWLARHPEEAATASVDWAAVRSRRPSPE